MHISGPRPTVAVGRELGRPVQNLRYQRHRGKSAAADLALRLAAALLIGLAVSGSLARPAQAQAADFAIDDGWFFTQTGGYTADPGDGYAVRDDSDAMFWTAFQELGGVATVGYPVTRRFWWYGFETQAFQKAVFQWRRDTGEVLFANVFDDLNRLGHDEELEARLIPRQEMLYEPGLDFAGYIARAHALLDEEPALRAAYDALDDPLRWYGLPQSRVREYGDGLVRTIRLQRVVLQLWTRDVPWARAGQVTVANGGKEAKALGLWPVESILPEHPPAAWPGSAPGTAAAGEPNLLWQIPMEPDRRSLFPHHTEIRDGVAIVRTGPAAIMALDAASGETLWRYELSDERAEIPSWLFDGDVYVTRHFDPTPNEEYANRGLESTVDVVALDARSGERIWQYWDTNGARPLIWRDVLVLGSGPEQGLVRSSGQRIWETRVSGHSNYAAGGTIYYDEQGTVAALDMESGSIRWQRELSDLGRIAGAVADRAIFAGDASIVAIDARSGAVSWKYQIPGRDLRFRFVVDGLVVVDFWTLPPPSIYPHLPDPDGVCVLDPAAGQVLWCRDIDLGTYAIWGQDGAVGVTTRDRAALLSPRTGAELWSRARTDKDSDRDPQAILHGGYVYEEFPQEIVAYGAASGSVLWRYARYRSDTFDQLRRARLLAAADGLAIVWTGSGLAGLGVAGD